MLEYNAEMNLNPEVLFIVAKANSYDRGLYNSRFVGACFSRDMLEYNAEMNLNPEALFIVAEANSYNRVDY